MTRLFLALALMAAGCDDAASSDDDDDATTEEAATVQEVCARVFECGGWGWEDQAACEDGWIDSAEHGTECADTSGYLACVNDCLGSDCDAFASCETDCWNGSCQ